MNAKYSNWKMLGKAVAVLAIGQVILSVQAGDPETVLSDPRSWAVTVGAAIFKAIWNAWKNRNMEGSPFHSYYLSTMCLGLCAAALCMHGCVTTTLPDGTTETRVDQEGVGAIGSLIDTFLPLVLARDESMVFPEAWDPVAESKRQENLALIDAMIAPIQEQLLEAGIEYVEQPDGKWRSVKTLRVMEGHAEINLRE